MSLTSLTMKLDWNGKDCSVPTAMLFPSERMNNRSSVALDWIATGGHVVHLERDL